MLRLQKIYSNKILIGTFLQNNSKNFVGTDMSYFVNYSEVPFLALFSMYQHISLCVAVIVAQKTALTSGNCAKRNGYHGREFMLSYEVQSANHFNYKDEGFLDKTWSGIQRLFGWYKGKWQPIHNALFLKGNSEDDPDICILKTSKEIDFSEKTAYPIAWPHKKSGSMSKFHRICIIYGWDVTEAKRVGAIIGRVITNRGCQKLYKQVVREDQFCLRTIKYSKYNGPCSFLMGGPVQCNGVIEGILSDPNNDQCNSHYRIYIVTRFDYYYSFIYEASGYRKASLLSKSTTSNYANLNKKMLFQEIPQGRSAIETVQDTLVPYFHNLSEQVFNTELYKKASDFVSDNGIWTTFPLIFKLLVLLGIFVFFREKHGKRRPSKHKMKTERLRKTKIIKSVKRKKMDVSGEETQIDLEDVEPAPIYYDPRTGSYFYPRKAINEVVPSTRDLIIESPKLLSYDKKSNLYFSKEIGDIYIKLTDPEEFKRKRADTFERLLTHEEKSKAQRTPIYYNTKTEKHFYPALAIFDHSSIERETITTEKPPLKYKKSKREYTHKKTKQLYIEFTNTDSFTKLRCQTSSLKHEEDAKELVQLTPIYIDPDSDILLYPKTAVEEPVSYKRQKSRERPPLFFDPKKKVYYDYLIGELYIPTRSTAEFNQLRQNFLRIVAENEQRSRKILWPIYFDVKNNTHYYPNMALKEKVLQAREVIKIKSPLPFDTLKCTFVAPGTKISYTLIRSQSDLERKREALSGLTKPIVEGTVYIDSKKRKYFYPKYALDPFIEFVANEKRKKRVPIKLNRKLCKFVHKKNAEEYVAFNSHEEFKQFKEKTKHGEKIQFYGKSPIYYDCRKYYYPKSCLDESFPTIRQIVQGPSPLVKVKHSKRYMDPETQEIFVPFKSPKQFSKTLERRKKKIMNKQLKLFIRKNPSYIKKKKKNLPKYYYPIKSLSEPNTVKRKLKKLKKSILLRDIETGNYMHRKTGELYMETTSPAEFFELKDQKQKEKEEELQAEDDAQLTIIKNSPIYFEDDKYYYPKKSLTEQKDLLRDIIVGIDALKYVGNLNEWVNQKTGDMYLELSGPVEFLRIRQAALETIAEEQREQKRINQMLLETARKTPIYFDENSNVYYYPEKAFEEENYVYRITLLYKNQLDYNKKKNLYLDHKTQNIYIKVANVEEYKIMRNKKLAELRNQAEELARLEKLKEDRSKTPIYFKKKEKTYYYPETAFIIKENLPFETKDLENDLVSGETPDIWIHVLTGTRYFEVSNPKKFEALRKERLEKETSDEAPIESKIEEIQEIDNRDTILIESQAGQIKNEYSHVENDKVLIKVTSKEDLDDLNKTTKSEVIKVDSGQDENHKITENLVTVSQKRSTEFFEEKIHNKVEKPDEGVEDFEISGPAPIIYAESAKIYFYPEEVLSESQRVLRPTVPWTGQLKLHQEPDRYTQIHTKETYMEINNQAKLNALRDVDHDKITKTPFETTTEESEKDTR